MTIDEITEFIQALGGVLTLRPEPGDGSPEISWGDRFFYYTTTGEIPRTQPFATIVTKNYPDEPGAADVVIAHPVYGRLGWLAVVDPGPATRSAIEELLRNAHAAARSRYERRPRRP